MTRVYPLIALSFTLLGCSVMPSTVQERFADPNVHVVNEPYQPGAMSVQNARLGDDPDQPAPIAQAYYPATGGAVVEAVADNETSSGDHQRPHIVRAGRLRNNLDAILIDYGWVGADFSAIPDCAHWRVSADYTLVANGVADAVQRLLEGYPLVVDMHRPTRQARVSYSGRTPIRCDA